MEELKVTAYDNGDMSVGIWPSKVEITFKADFDFMDSINYADNRKTFKEELAKFVQEWFTDMPTYVVFEDECVDCGQRLEKKKRGKGYKKHKCPLVEALRR